jgi:hypothetical protein
MTEKHGGRGARPFHALDEHVKAASAEIVTPEAKVTSAKVRDCFPAVMNHRRAGGLKGRDEPPPGNDTYPLHFTSLLGHDPCGTGARSAEM